jgi:hypothetical protein
MKKINLLTRKFINDNIKVNTGASSYPLRKVAPVIPAPKDNKATLS